MNLVANMYSTWELAVFIVAMNGIERYDEHTSACDVARFSTYIIIALLHIAQHVLHIHVWISIDNQVARKG